MMVATLPPRKVWRTLVSATLFLMAFFINLYAQANTDDKGTIPVTISGTDIRLEKVFKSIEKQTGLRFNYRSDLLNLNDKVTVNYRNKPLDEILAALLQPRGFVWKYLGSAITLQPAPAVAPVTPSDTLITFSGRVLNDEGTPLPGATVKVKGTTIGTASSSDGGFSLKTSGNSTIVVSYTGYRSQEMRAGRSMAMVKLEKAINDMNEQVVVAYGTTTQRSNVGAVTVIKGEQIQTLPNRSFDKSLQGVVPGLLVTNGTGQPGGGVSNLLLRGISTGAQLGYASTARNPLIIIDGMPVTQEAFNSRISSDATPVSNPMAQLNPSDIETISVLKDAAAISLYGSKASNGVIVVTTKRGRSGRTTISISHQTDISWRPKPKFDVLNQEQYLELLYETYRNTNATRWTDEAIFQDLISKFPYQISGTDTSFYPSPNWEKSLYNNQAMTFVNNISLNGGNENSTFYLNLEYTKQDGIVKGTGYDRKSVRFNYSTKPVSWLKVILNNTLSYNKQNIANTNESTNSYAAVELMSPLNPIKLDNGEYVNNYSWGIYGASGGWSVVPNPYLVTKYSYDRANSFRGLSTVTAEATILKSLIFSTTLGADFMLAETKLSEDPRLVSYGTYQRGYIIDQSNRNANIISTNLLRYNFRFNRDNQINITIGHEAQILTSKTMGITATGSEETLPLFDEINSPGYRFSSFNANNTKHTLLSQFAHINYGFKNRYFMTASYRRDASSLFGVNERWGDYWSTGTGWLISEEPFMHSISKTINYLKIRGSIGAAGNSAALSNLSKYNIIDQQKYLGNIAFTNQAIPGNPNIKWEETFNWNAGIETKLLQERIAVTADLYNKRTKNMIYSMPVPAYTGYVSVPSNIGTMRNSGIEIMLTATIFKKQQFSWTTSSMWSKNSNKLIKANIPLMSANIGYIANEEGREYNSFYMPVWLGVDPSNGSPLWKGPKGAATSKYSQAVPEFVGKTQPDGFGNITNTIAWKSWEASARIYYQYGFQILNSNLTYLLSDGWLPYGNSPTDALDRWKKPGDQSKNPIRKLDNTSLSNRTSTRQLFDGDYIRIQNINISYLMPTSTLQKLNIAMFKIFIQGSNLFQFTKDKWADPDNVSLGGSAKFPYPTAKSLSAGIQISIN